MGIIESEVRITGQDAGASAMIARISQKLDQMGRAAKISPEVDKLANSLSKAEAQLRAIDKLNATQSLSSASRGKVDDARKRVQELKSAMEGIEAPTKRMTAALNAAQAAEERAIKQFRRRRTAVLEARSSLAGYGLSLNQIGSAESSLKSRVDATTAALEKQMVVERRQAAEAAAQAKTMTARLGRGHGDSTLAGLAGMYVGHEVGHLAHNVIERYQEFDRERRYAKVVMGLTDQEQEPLIRQAIHGGSTTRFNDIQWLESQRELASRGYNRDQVMAFAPIAAQIGQSFDKTMPDGVKALEGALLGFHKDTSTYAAAMASASRTADLQVKASKISGMSYEDVVAAYKYAAAPAQMAHLSEEQMLAFSAISKKANMAGDESGVAFRALAKNLMTPTADAKTAMLAQGIDFSKYQTAPKAVDLDAFSRDVAMKYGVHLSSASRSGLAGIFSDPEMLGDPAKFTPAVVQALKSTLGKQDAKSLKSIAGDARKFRDDSVGGVDSNGLMTAIMTGMSRNPMLANAIFGGKQGGRIFAALGDPAFYAKILGELQHESQGYAGKVSDARTEGFNGAIQKLQGTIANVETAIGRSLDNNGNGGLLTQGTEAITGLLQAFTDATPQVHQLAVAGGAAAAAWGAIKSFDLFKGGFGLQAAATHLDEAAVALKGAASVEGKGVGGLGGLPGEPGKSPGLKPLLPRALGYLGTSFPIIMSAYDDVTHPKDRQKRYDQQAEEAEGRRAWFGDVVRGARDRLGLGGLLRFGDDHDDMLPNEQGPRLPRRLLEQDALERALRKIHVDTPLDPYLSGERQAIDHRAIASADAFRRDAESARGAAMMASQGSMIGGPLDIRPQIQRTTSAGLSPIAPPYNPEPVSVDVKVGDPKFEGSLKVSAEPSQWLIAKIENLTQMFSMGATSAAVSSPSTGKTVPNAGIAHPAGRGD